MFPPLCFCPYWFSSGRFRVSLSNKHWWLYWKIKFRIIKKFLKKKVIKFLKQGWERRGLFVFTLPHFSLTTERNKVLFVNSYKLYGTSDVSVHVLPRRVSNSTNIDYLLVFYYTCFRGPSTLIYHSIYLLSPMVYTTILTIKDLCLNIRYSRNEFTKFYKEV